MRKDGTGEGIGHCHRQFIGGLAADFRDPFLGRFRSLGAGIFCDDAKAQLARPDHLNPFGTDRHDQGDKFIARNCLHFIAPFGYIPKRHGRMSHILFPFYQ